MPCFSRARACICFFQRSRATEGEEEARTSMIRVPSGRNPNVYAMRRRFSELHRTNDMVVILRGRERFETYFRQGEAVGEGGFGKIFRGTFTNQGLRMLPGLEMGCTYVAKRVRKLKSDNDMEEIQRSFIQLTSERHMEFLHCCNSAQCSDNYFLRVYGEFVEEGGPTPSLYIILENLEGPDMLDWLSTLEGTVPEQQAAELVRQMLIALQFIHRTAGALHRDIKYENFGFSRKVLPGAPLPPLRLFDLGLCWVLPEVVTPDTASSLYELNPCGTAVWMAPETWLGRSGPPSDTWGIGVALHDMLTFCWPFNLLACRNDDNKAVAVAVHRGQLDFTTQDWRSVSPAAMDLVKQLLDKDVAVRATTEQALTHRWLNAAGECSPGECSPGARPKNLSRQRRESTYWSAVASAAYTLAEI